MLMQAARAMPQSFKLSWCASKDACMYFEAEFVMTVQDHQASLISVPNESAYTQLPISDQYHLRETDTTDRPAFSSVTRSPTAYPLQNDPNQHRNP